MHSLVCVTKRTMSYVGTQWKVSSSLTALTVDADEPERFKNAPIGLQVIGGPLEEEAVIAMTEVVDAALKTLSALPV